ncbi:SprT-like domain-containing protein [Micromonospora okii]|uniref:SprT-like domain-containing protein n=1 Tax=Micromonospora okii TaxID=1182970 RepID=UPI001E58FE89|nr:SprT-like domain-containing protein [Micromonospora okii]
MTAQHSTWATVKGHGKPETLMYHGGNRKGPDANGILVRVERYHSGYFLRAVEGGRAVRDLGVASRFWAAPVEVTDTPEPKTVTDVSAPVAGAVPTPAQARALVAALIDQAYHGRDFADLFASNARADMIARMHAAGWVEDPEVIGLPSKAFRVTLAGRDAVAHLIPQRAIDRAHAAALREHAEREGRHLTKVGVPHRTVCGKVAANVPVTALPRKATCPKCVPVPPAWPVAARREETPAPRVCNAEAPAQGRAFGTREEWLVEAVDMFVPIFAAVGAQLPRVRVSVGWPGVSSRKGLHKVIGQCWASTVSADKVPQVFISPVLDDAGTVLATLAHELVHAVDDCASGHKAPFARLARGIGLAGKMTATHAGDALAARLAEIADHLGPYPHARLSTGAAGAGAGEKKQTTRMIKCECGCGYAVRTTRKWLDSVGAPICPACVERLTVCD